MADNRADGCRAGERSGLGNMRRTNVQPFEKVLLPVDGSTLGEGIIPYAAQIAKGSEAAVTVLYVASREGLDSRGAMVHRDSEAPPVTLQEYLGDIEARLAGAGIGSADHAIVTGVPWTGIVDYAESHAYDLIAMATHGRSGLGRWRAGSTTDRVLHSTELPMLLLRPSGPDGPESGPTELRRAIVPLDGSPLSETSLPTAGALAGKLGLEVALLRVVPTVPLAYLEYEPYSQDFDPRIEEQMNVAADDYLERIGDGLGGNTQVSRHRLNGRAAAEIVDFAANDAEGLIVMSTHGRSGVGRWVLGSVADRVVCSSHRPVLLVRPHPQAGTSS